jgi:predicted nuclease of restriction endonuclease-like RecB superfamily
MLTSKQVRVRFARDKIAPVYMKTDDPQWLEWAETLLAIFRSASGRTHGELDEELDEVFASVPQSIVPQGLAKLLEDRCEFETQAEHPPEQVREAVFLAAARSRAAATIEKSAPVGTATPSPPFPLPRSGGEEERFDRDAVLNGVATSLNVESALLDACLFADLKSEQRLIRFDDVTAPRLLERYNVALAQALLLKSTRVDVTIRGETPQRYRQLFRQVKFRRLICEVESAGPNAYRFHLDGPLSLFSATQKYGLQLALFLPALLLCEEFELTAELRWGAERKPKTFKLSSNDGLVSHAADQGMYEPPEIAMFEELFRKKIADWELAEQPEILPVGNGFWVPDYRLVHKATGRSVYLEILGFWRRSSLAKLLEQLKIMNNVFFILAISEQLHAEEADLDGLSVDVVRFRNMPLPEEIVKRAEILIQ